jgi:hypothetical protein
LALFRRILSDPEYLAGRTDTGYLDRLPRPESPIGDSHEEVAAIAAAIFASAAPAANANGSSPAHDASNWKKLARTESLR